MVLGALHTCSVISLFDKFKAFDYISISHKSGFFLLFSYKRPYNAFFTAWWQMMYFIGPYFWFWWFQLLTIPNRWIKTLLSSGSSGLDGNSDHVAHLPTPPPPEPQYF